MGPGACRGVDQIQAADDARGHRAGNQVELALLIDQRQVAQGRRRYWCTRGSCPSAAASNRSTPRRGFDRERTRLAGSSGSTALELPEVGARCRASPLRSSSRPRPSGANPRQARPQRGGLGWRRPLPRALRASASGVRHPAGQIGGEQVGSGVAAAEAGRVTRPRRSRVRAAGAVIGPTSRTGASDSRSRRRPASRPGAAGAAAGSGWRGVAGAAAAAGMSSRSISRSRPVLPVPPAPRLLLKGDSLAVMRPEYGRRPGNARRSAVHRRLSR